MNDPTLPELGITISARARLSLSDYPKWGAAAENSGAKWIFVNEAGNNPLLSAAALGQATKDVQIGTGVVNIYLRQPYVTAASSALIAEATGGRFSLGLGIGHYFQNRDQLGLDMSKPLSRLIDYLRAIRATLNGASDYSGEFYSMRAPLWNSPSADVPIYAAALRPTAVRKLLPHVDGLILNFPTPGYLEYLRSEAIPAGLEKRESDDPVKLVAYVHGVVPGSTEAATQEEGIALVLQYARSENYRRMFELSGFAAEAEAFRRAFRDDDLPAKRRAVSDRLLEELSVLNAPQEYFASLRSLGIDVAVLHPRPTDGDWANALGWTLSRIEDLTR